jgi:hypothetical protein
VGTLVGKGVGSEEGVNVGFEDGMVGEDVGELELVGEYVGKGVAGVVGKLLGEREMVGTGVGDGVGQLSMLPKLVNAVNTDSRAGTSPHNKL